MLIDQLHKCNADITAIQEVRWTASGALEKKECTVFYSCSANKHQLGTGFIIDKKVRHLAIGFTLVNERISCLCVRGKFSNCSIINAHAPAEEKPEEEKEAVYEVLEKTYDACSRGDIKIVLGDMTAQIGKEDIYIKTIGKHSLHSQSNDNELRLINFAGSMTIGSSVEPR
jgi:exonuclease III